MKQFIKIHPQDNVAVALQDLAAGTSLTINNQKVSLRTDILRGHKFALCPIKVNENIIKYGHPIGYATQSIQLGEHVHTQNVKTNLTDINDYKFEPKSTVLSSQIPDRKVQIYRRKNGDIGIRNELWIVPTVGCVVGIANQIKKAFMQNHDLSDIDGVFTFNHSYGCSQLGDDHENTKIMLQNMAQHPNAGGVLVIGLGCENNQISEFKESLGEFDSNRIKFMISQDCENEIAVGMKLLQQLYAEMRQDHRQSGFLSEIKFGLECGGSDGLSGITANPMLGCFSDYITSHGGTTVLTEIPEMFGAERILMSHCKDKETFYKTVQLINDFKQYYIDYNQPIYENPSPGNKAGGITTLEDKSLGCTQKAGYSQVVDVLKYGERLKINGLNLLSAPGNDAVATSALAGAGCHMVLFTTGRGTPYGGFVPTVKIATNSELARKKEHWIDFDAGRLIYDLSMEQLLNHFIDLLVEIVNGKPTKNELNEFRELAIFKNGVTL